MIYLDNAATTRMDPRVFTAMLPWLTEQYGNPGSLYPFGGEAKEKIAASRAFVSQVFNCRPENVLFTSGGSEGNNLVIKGLSRHLRNTGRTTILYSAIEHDSVIHAVESMCVNDGFEGRAIPVCANGSLDMEAFKSMLSEAVGLVSVMYVNNETGTKVWNEEIVRMCRELGILIHTDCVQAAYDYDLDVSKRRISPDFATISSHKIHGPKGMGAVYAYDPSLLSAVISGGKEQEFGLRGGTENVAGIVGFGKACEILCNKYDGESDIDPSDYARIFLDELTNQIGSDAFCVNAEDGKPHKTINICVPGIDGQSLVLIAGASGVCISAGSACRSLESEPSHVLKAIGLSDEDARSSFRVSFSRMNNEFEVKEGARVIAECIKTLKGVLA